MREVIFNLESLVCGIPLISILIITHIYFTLKLKFPQKYMLKGLKYMFLSDKTNNKNGISSFKSLMAVLASTLGTGNIIGVATAITIGGVGSILWIFISGVLGIATKYAETYIVLKYRKKDKNGKYYGGAMYVLRDKLKYIKLSKIFAIFLIITTFGMGAMIQSNAISTCITSNYNVNIYLIAIFIVISCGYVLLGNEKRIANVSSVLIPIATIVYLVACFVLLYQYRQNIIPSIIQIVKSGLNIKSGLAGTITGPLGVSFVKTVSTGLSKGLFTNEAGMGTSPIFDVKVKEENITKQSIISSTSVFIDTVVLCTITGIVFVSTGMYKITTNPALIANYTFSILPYGKYIYIFMIVVFAISTIPCSGYYGTVGVSFVKNDNLVWLKLYRIVFLACVFIGAISKIEIIWSISSISNALLVLPNIIMLFKLKDYVSPHI